MSPFVSLLLLLLRPLLVTHRRSVSGDGAYAGRHAPRTASERRAAESSCGARLKRMSSAVVWEQRTSTESNWCHASGPAPGEAGGAGGGRSPPPAAPALLATPPASRPSVWPCIHGGPRPSDGRRLLVAAARSQGSVVPDSSLVQSVIRRLCLALLLSLFFSWPHSLTHSHSQHDTGRGRGGPPGAAVAVSAADCSWPQLTAAACCSWL